MTFNFTFGINKKNNRLSISGENMDVFREGRAFLYFEDLEVQFIEGQMLIPYEPDTLESVYVKTISCLERLEFKYETTRELQEAAKIFIEKEQAFELFSSKARDIRNNKYDLDDFTHFKSALEERMVKGQGLYPLQLLSAYHLSFSQHACNFSVPGAGKTRVVYGAYTYLKSLPENDKKHVDYLLVVGPLSCYAPWEKEYQEVFGKKANSKRIKGLSSEEQTQHFFSANPPEITLMSYQGLSFATDDVINFLSNKKVMVVLDEAHKIKRVDGGVWAGTIKKIAPYCTSRVILTGTPAPKGYEDLYNLYHFIWPDKNILRFNPQHLISMTHNLNDERINELVENAAPFFIRIKKSQLDIPPATVHPTIVVPMGRAQKEIYNYIDSSYKSAIESANQSEDINQFFAKARVIRLMQAATNPQLLNSSMERHFAEEGITNNLFIDDSEILNKIRNYISDETPPKFKEVLKLVNKIINENGKVIIWTTFIGNIIALSNYLEKEGVSTKLLYGEIPVEQDNQDEFLETREKIIDEFHEEDSSFSVIIANPAAVSESISLHKACHNAIYMDRNYNAANFMQSKDRIHRKGLSPDTVTNYYTLISEGTIDIDIDHILSLREKRMLDIIENQPIPLINMNLDYESDTQDELKLLIKEYISRTSKYDN